MNPCRIPASRIAVTLTVLFLAEVASAGEIKGKASDSLGEALAGAQVTVENAATGAVIVALTDQTGMYSFTGLSAGTYRLTAQAAGFSQIARNIILATEADTAEANFLLRVGNLQSEVTVTASRNARDALVVPLRAESLGAEAMAATNPASPGELLIEATGVTPVGSGPFQMRPRLRGLDSTRVLVLVDGERLNNARTATDRAGVEVGLVDASSIESIEVVSGAGSVLYGTDALSGTVNILTAQPQFSDKTRFIGTLNGYYSSNENGRRGNAAVGVSGQRYALSLSGGKESFDNYKSGGKDGSVLEDSRPLYANRTLMQADTADTNFGFTFGAFPDPFNAPFVRTSTEIPSSFLDGTTVNANALVSLNDKQSLRVKYFHREAEDVGFPDFVPPQFFQGIVLPHSKLDKVSARYQVRSINSWFSHLSATAYYQKQDRLLRNIDIPVQFPAPTAGSFFPINIFRLVINSDTGQKIKTQGFDLQNTFLMSPKNVVTAGFTYYQDDSADYRTSSTQFNLVGQVVLGSRGPAAVVFPSLLALGPPTVSSPTRVPNATFADFGVFAQDEWDLTDKVRLVAGLRLDNYKVNTDPTTGYNIAAVIAGTTPAINPATLPNATGDSISRTAFTGDVGLVVKQSEKLSFIAHYGRSYRHPNLEELLFAGPATIGSIAPNITVGPERGDNIDLGLKFRSAQVQGSFSYFNNKYSDFISTEITALTASSSVSQAVNFADLRIQGVEGDLQGSWEQGPSIVSVFANGSYNKGEVLKGTNPLAKTSIAGTPQDNITPLKLIAGLHLSDKKQRFWGEYSFRYQKKVDRVATTLEDSPFLIFQDLAALSGFTIHRVGVGYDWRKGRKTLGITVNLENVGNKFYREQFQFAPARGRSVTVGLRAGSR
ncbi:MAG: TonB-dependent receptor [Vicinamibacteria bacterium]|nr:TonB-dependent receptor [Vicinamibacteria bacterium]